MILKGAETERWTRAAPTVVSRAKRLFLHLDTAFVLLLYLGLVASAPRIFDALQIQPDEGFELIKGFLCWQGFDLYVDIWNDQPPLHTLLLKWLFSVTGPSIQAARGLAVAFGLIFVLSFHVVVKQTGGNLAGAIAPLLLMLSPGFFPLSVAVMLEIPACALALCSLACAQRFVRRQARAAFVLCTMLAAVALQVKFTAGIIFPGIIMVLTQADPSSLQARNSATIQVVRWTKLGSLLVPLYWTICVTIAFLLLSLLLGSGFQDAYRSHFSEGIQRAANDYPHLKFRLNILEEHFEALVGTAMAVVFMLMRKDVSRLIAPLTLASFVLFVHLLHFPWWNYYYVHFAIPLCWMSAYALSIALKAVTGRLAPAWRWSIGEQVFCGVVAAMLCAAIWHAGWPRLKLDLFYLRTLHTAASNPLIQKIGEKRETTTWIFAPNGLGVYGFHARLPVHPSLAIMPHKRFWSGDLTVEQVVTEVNRILPQQLLIEFPLTQKPWDALGEKYTEVAKYGTISLYVLKN